MSFPSQTFAAAAVTPRDPSALHAATAAPIGAPETPASRIPRPFGISLMLICIVAFALVERDRRRRIARIRALDDED